MDKIVIDKAVSKKADEFAEREYVSGAYEREWLSKGYYWGYKDAEKELGLTIDDVREIIHIYEITAGLLGDELTDDNTKRILDEYNRRKRL